MQATLPSLEPEGDLTDEPTLLQGRLGGRQSQQSLRRDVPTASPLPTHSAAASGVSGGWTAPVAMEIDPSVREKRKATEEESWHHEEVRARTTERSLGDQPSASVELINKHGPPWYDDLDDHVLDTKQVEIGMQSELNSFKQMEVKEDVPYSAYEQDPNPNKQLVSSRFVLVDRSKPGAPRVKARIVAQQLNLSGGTWAETFAATPTTLGQRLLLWHAAKNGWKVQTADVSTAFLHASLPAGDAVYIIPPVNLREGTGLWKLHSFVRLEASTSLVPRAPCQGVGQAWIHQVGC